MLAKQSRHIQEPCPGQYTSAIGRSCRVLVLAVLVVGVSGCNSKSESVPPASEDMIDVSIVLRENIMNHYSALQQEDLASALSYVHTDSQTYEGLRSGQPSVLARFDYLYELTNITYLGTDRNFAYQSSNVRKSVLKPQNTALNDTDSFMLVAFREQESRWRIWAFSLLHWDIVDANEQSAGGQTTPPTCSMCVSLDPWLLERKLLGLVGDYLNSLNNEPRDKILAYAYPDSPFHETLSKKPWLALPGSSRPNFEIDHIHFVGYDDHYAYVSLEISKSYSFAASDAFPDAELFQAVLPSRETVVFAIGDHQGAWRVWTEGRLEFEYTGETKIN